MSQAKYFFVNVCTFIVGERRSKIYFRSMIYCASFFKVCISDVFEDSVISDIHICPFILSVVPNESCIWSIFLMREATGIGGKAGYRLEHGQMLNTNGQGLSPLKRFLIYHTLLMAPSLWAAGNWIGKHLKKWWAEPESTNGLIGL